MFLGWLSTTLLTPTSSSVHELIPLHHIPQIMLICYSHNIGNLLTCNPQQNTYLLFQSDSLFCLHFCSTPSPPLLRYSINPAHYQLFITWRGFPSSYKSFHPGFPHCLLMLTTVASELFLLGWLWDVWLPNIPLLLNLLTLWPLRPTRFDILHISGVNTAHFY